jgi:hypothetical protein
MGCVNRAVTLWGSPWILLSRLLSFLRQSLSSLPHAPTRQAELKPGELTAAPSTQSGDSINVMPMRHSTLLLQLLLTPQAGTVASLRQMPN